MDENEETERSYEITYKFVVDAEDESAAAAAAEEYLSTMHSQMEPDSIDEI